MGELGERKLFALAKEKSTGGVFALTPRKLARVLVPL